STFKGCGSEQPAQNIRGDLGPEVRIRFEYPSNIREILLTLAAATSLIAHSPDLGSYEITDIGYRHLCTQHLPGRRALDKIEIAVVRLYLNPQIRTGEREVDAMRK